MCFMVDVMNNESRVKSQAFVCLYPMDPLIAHAELDKVDIDLFLLMGGVTSN